MNDSNANDPIQPQKSSLKVTPSLENTPNEIDQKGNFLIILGIVFLIVVVGVGGYFLGAKTNQVQTPNNAQSLPTNNVTKAEPTNSTTESTSTSRINSDGQTIYTNSELGFSFKYPSKNYLFRGLSLSELSQGEGNVRSVSIQFCPSQKLEDCAFPANMFSISFFQNSKKWGLDQWIKSALNSPIYAMGKENCYVKDSRTTQSKQQYLSYPAYVVSFIIDEKTSKEVCSGAPLEGGGRFKDIIMEKNGQIVTLNISGASENNYKELEQILASFKFQ